VSIRITGASVLLRPFRESEAATLWDQGWKDRGDLDIPWPDDDVSRERFDARVAASGSWLDEHVLDLGIEAHDGLIGDVQARHCVQTTPPGLFELGVWLFAGTRGRGYGTEALTLITRFLFDDEGAHRVQLGTDTENMAMRRAAEKAGFRLEGTMRGFWPSLDGAPRDYALYARTRADHQGRDREGS
jgi:RimJ/RimL family protein N-acetyltransferase